MAAEQAGSQKAYEILQNIKNQEVTGCNDNALFLIISCCATLYVCVFSYFSFEFSTSLWLSRSLLLSLPLSLSQSTHANLIFISVLAKCFQFIYPSIGVDLSFFSRLEDELFTFPNHLSNSLPLLFVDVPNPTAPFIRYRLFSSFTFLPPLLFL